MKFCKEMPNIESVLEGICGYFDEARIERTAKETGFIVRPKKLTGMSFFCLCILHNFGSSLGILCGALRGSSITMCEQSLNERFTDSAVSFMKRMFVQILALELSKSMQLAFLDRFSGVFVQDSTVIKLPDAMKEIFKGVGGSSSSSSVKADLSMDLQGSSVHIELRAGASSDNAKRAIEIRKGALYLRDLGYYSLDFFVNVILEGAYFISRLRFKSVVYGDSQGKKALNIVEMGKGMEVGQTLRLPVFIGSGKFVPVLLVIQRLPPQVVAVKIKRAKDDHRSRMTTMKAEHVEWCGINTYITNIPEDWFEPQAIVQIYTIRWQIEIMFKVWKSIFKVAEVGKMNSNRILCTLYGRLIWILMNMKIFAEYRKDIYSVSQKEVSELAAFRQMNEHKTQFREAIKSGQRQVWYELIMTLFRIVQDFAIKKKRKKNVPILYNTVFKTVIQQ